MFVYIILTLVIAVFINLIYKRQHRIELKNKHVVVVGGSSGIGKELVFLLLQEKCATVSVLSRSIQKLNDVKDEAKKYGEIDVYSCDVTNKENVKRTFKDIIAKNGKIDCLINCAGLAIPGYFIEQDNDIFEKTMQLDYFGSLYATKETVPNMIKNGGGHIVFVSSTCGLVGVPGYSTYCPSKFAVKGLAEVLRSELKPYKITFSVVYPPDTDTPGYEQENLTKPEETVIISGAAGKAAPAINVAKCIITGIKNGDYHIAYDVATKLCAVLSPGFTPFYFSFFDILLAPICRIVGVIAMYQNDSAVLTVWKKKNNNGNRTSN
eukprot:gene7634-9391_t